MTRRGRALAGALVAVALASPASGCGALFDLTYTMGDGRYSETVEERRPTDQQRVAIEYAAAVEPDGRLRLSCARRARAIERVFSTHKAYQRRGGWDRGTYLGAAIISGVVAAGIGAAAGLACTREDRDVSCWHLMWAAPYALDVGYSALRRATVPPPKLVDRRTDDGDLQLGAVLSDEAVSCAEVRAVALGGASGPSDDDVLEGRGDGAPRRLAAAATILTVAADGAIDLAASPDAPGAWASGGWMELWAVDGDGVPHRVEVDRCAALRPHVGRFAGPALATFQADCPLPTVTVP